MGIFDAFSGKSQRRAAQAMDWRIGQGHQQAFRELDAGLDRGRELYGQARADYAPLYELGRQGATRYAGALGLRGPEGIAEAQAGFQAGPGYQYALDQGEQALMRNASAMGRLASGNTSLDLLRHAQGMANQEWGNYMNRLGGYNQMLGQAAAGRAGLNQGLAGLEAGIFGNKANTAWQANLGQGEAAQSNIMAGQQAMQNAWNFGQGLLGLGADIWGQRNGRQGPQYYGYGA